MEEIQIHGGDIYRNQGVLDFSVNRNPLGAPAPVLEAVCRSAQEIACYPDITCGGLREAIGRFEGVSPEEVLCGNGAAELFFAAVLAKMPKRALVLAPTFSEYESALKTVKTNIAYYILREEHDFTICEDILDWITPETDMMFLCNPNNPIGDLISPEILDKILEKCIAYDIFLVVDECFLDFTDSPRTYELIRRRGEFPNLLVVKAFTKLFAVPGLRLGYAVTGNRKLAQRMKGVLQPWNVSVPAQAGGVAALTDCGEYRLTEYLKETRALVAKERTFMKAELEKLGFHTYPSEANYLFFHGRPGLYELALEHGFLIRDCRGYRGLEAGYYRIAVRKREENERLLSWLRGL